MNWADYGLNTEAGELAILVIITGMLYRLLRMKYPDVPEVVVQFIAAILSTALNLAILWQPGMLIHQWIVIGIARGVLRSQNVVKSIDWIATAATKTGAPAVGLPEKPPAWFVAELAKGTTVETTEPVKVRSRADLLEQIRVNEAAQADVKAKLDALTPTPKRVEPAPAVVAPAPAAPMPPVVPRVPRERDLPGGLA